MKRFLLHFPIWSILGCSVLVLAFACSKDKPSDELQETYTLEEVKHSTSSFLSGVDSLSSFSQFYAEASLTAADVAQGLTLLALPNAKGPQTAQATKSASLTAWYGLEDESLFNVRDHLVKGILSKEDLTHGKTLTALSGKSLLVIKQGNDTYLNGVNVSQPGAGNGKGFVVHVVAEVLSDKEPAQAGKLEVTIWDALKWSPAKPKGEIAAGATVKLYRSKEDFTNNEIYRTTQTDAQGIARFDPLFPGEYFLVAEYWENPELLLSSIVRVQTGPQTWLALAHDALFQTAEEAQALGFQDPHRYVGNFKPVDLNGDGIINDNDLVTAPYHSVELESGATETYEIIVGTENNHQYLPAVTSQEFVNDLESVYWGFYNDNKEWTILDAVLAGDADCQTIRATGSYVPLFNYCQLQQFNYLGSANNIWSSHFYQLQRINRLLISAQTLDFQPQPDQFPSGNKEQLVAILKALRAAVYTSLLKWYGDAPIQEGIFLAADAMRASKADVYNFIKKDLDEARPALPAVQNNREVFISAHAVDALYARAALVMKDYDVALSKTQAIINYGAYQLTSNQHGGFGSSTNSEIIWIDWYGRGPNNNFPGFFDRGDYIVAIRYTEVLLISAEAAVELDSLSRARNIINILQQRDGIPLTTTGSATALRSALQNLWRSELYREGHQFSALIRWGKAAETLGTRGFSAHHVLLPIPPDIIENYSGIVQNAGY